MHKHFILLSLVGVCALPSAAAAQTRTPAPASKMSIQGFGGFTFGNSSFVGGTSFGSTFGGTLAVDLTPNIQGIGEFGRMSDIKPPLFNLLEFTPADLRVPAWYGEGGVRFIAAPHSAVRPYGEATAGFARLSTDIDGFGGTGYEIAETALGYLNRTEPMFGVGGGIIFQGGPISLDVGYRFKRIVSSGLPSVLNGGNDYNINDVRIGLGIRF
jgi:opacity protein-like surface antigen